MWTLCCLDVVQFGMHVFACRVCFRLYDLLCACLVSMTQHEDVVESKGGDVTDSVFEGTYRSEFVCAFVYVGTYGVLPSRQNLGRPRFAECVSRVWFAWVRGSDVWLGDCYSLVRKE